MRKKEEILRNDNHWSHEEIALEVAIDFRDIFKGFEESLKEIVKIMNY